MAIPNYQTLMRPVLQAFADGAKNVADCLPSIQAMLNITDEEAAEVIPSGRITVLGSRAHWARTYLSKAGMLRSPARNQHVITDAGRALLERHPDRIDNSVLEQVAEFAAWRRSSQQESTPALSSGQEEADLTPDDQMQLSYARLTKALAEELLELLHDMPPLRFEQLILDLLAAMGFGGGRRANALLTPAVGDGGIDGIIHEDALGLDAVYIQAKRYAPDRTIGRPDIQRFVGSLTGESASKGVFVTTSDFSREALDYISKVQQRIVLINGQRLAQLMIEHNVGVRERHRYVIRSIDEDYFAT